MRQVLHVTGFTLALLLIIVGANLLYGFGHHIAALALAITGAVLLALGYQYLLWQPFAEQLKALSSLVAAWRDQDFSTSIAKPKNAGLNELTQTLNSLGDTLRSERVNLVQRELMLVF